MTYKQVDLKQQVNERRDSLVLTLYNIWLGRIMSTKSTTRRIERNATRFWKPKPKV